MPKTSLSPNFYSMIASSTLQLAFIGNFGGGEIILIFLIVLLLFGAKKVPELFRSLGKGVNEFRKAKSEWESDISDVMTGRDISIERQTPAEAGNQYGKTTIRVKPNQTALVEDANLSDNLLKNQPNIVELYSEPTFDELKGHLQNFLNPSATEETTEKEPEMVSTQASSNVEDDFDKLFNS